MERVHYSSLQPLGPPDSRLFACTQAVSEKQEDMASSLRYSADVLLS